jgi:hypothetical protein
LGRTGEESWRSNAARFGVIGIDGSNDPDAPKYYNTILAILLYYCDKV